MELSVILSFCYLPPLLSGPFKSVFPNLRVALRLTYLLVGFRSAFTPGSRFRQSQPNRCHICKISARYVLYVCYSIG